MPGRERPVRRTVAYACGIGVGGACIVVAGLFAFLAEVVDPVLYVIVVAFAVGAVAVIWWSLRALHRMDKAMQPIEDTVLLDLAAIARYQPPPRSRHPFDASWWRRARARGKRIKETAR